MKKSIAWVLTTIMMLALLTGCGSKSAKSDTEYVKKNGKLIVGITDYEPMDYKDENGEWTGFDAEFARMFAKELGVDCEFFVIADWGQKFFELDSKNIDAIWNGMTITDEPGIYETDEVGIRIENELECYHKADNQYGTFLAFRPLTFVPIATSPVVPGVLTRDELDWLNAYHREVFEKLAPRLNEEERDWLAKKCAAIGA